MMEPTPDASEWFPEEKCKAKKTWLQQTCCRILRRGPVPQHVAFIMDGNRRFARKLSVERAEGHLKGFDKLAETLQWCLDLGITEVTVYAFSIENFKRSKEEVDGLMELAKQKFKRLLEEKELIEKHEVCVRILGDLTMLPVELQQVVAEVVHISRNNTKAVLNVCFAYTARHEIANATKELAEGVQLGLLRPSDISEELLEQCLYTNQSRDPDLLVRTSGEVRLSDFLLWQSSYTVLSFVEVLWPEFSIWHLFSAVLHYQMNHHAVQAEKERSLTERREQVQQSDFQCTMAELGNMCNGIDETNSVQQKVTQYRQDREARIDRFLTHLNNKRLQFFANLLPAES
ncbi:dehydrodolichyl diphosphate synthase complex subunit DHDDS-like isoform X1 [Amphiura filiformis]|uniref:dehydrodolichyl diphosphate synthase complex subunit DHDDS-like isoform X1 n=1 Tax=Amphiura filiformis TaxID=82378 RepID=UPI003B21667F